MIQIRSWSLNPEEKSLTLEIIPEEFYDGDGLKTFAEVQQALSTGWMEENDHTGLYSWLTYNPENGDCFSDCYDNYHSNPYGRTDFCKAYCGIGI